MAPADKGRRDLTIAAESPSDPPLAGCGYNITVSAVLLNVSQPVYVETNSLVYDCMFSNISATSKLLFQGVSLGCDHCIHMQCVCNNTLHV